jgi:tetratricopeptide (TPR) repeat protein
MKPLCFVLVPSGKRPAAGSIVDFDAVYDDLIAPAVESADLEPLRSDEKMTEDIIHKSVFEGLILCEYAVVDLTTADANVYYELGVRQAVHGSSTVLVFAEGCRMPFDVSSMRAISYKLSDDGTPVDSERDKRILAERLADARNNAAGAGAKDTPLYQLVEDFPDLSHTKTDVFRERVQYSAQMKERLAEARTEGVEALRILEKEFAPLVDLESAVVIDLYLSYRAVKAWQEMIELHEKMSRPLGQTTMAQEQLAFALNRAGEYEAAERVLKQVLDRKGPSSETYSILGRVYKDQWESTLRERDSFLAQEFLGKAVEAYLRGFETDWRDGLPGINAVTLMELRDPPDPRRKQLIPIVTYAVERRIASGSADYWDYATCIELAVLEKNEEKALEAVAQALAHVREIWEPETTARNLRLIRESREIRREEVAWASGIEQELSNRAKS